MRVITVKALADDERGVAAIIIAICLVLILGVAALSVDAGGLYGKRRHLVTAADAAVLAAAQWCAKTGNSWTTAQAQANGIATANVPTALMDTPPSAVLQGVCGGTNAGKVRVQYHSDQVLHFAPVLGFGSTRPVHATSVAVWGPAGSAAGVSPFMLSAARLSTCQIPPPPGGLPIGTKCAFWWNNKDISNAQWGSLNLDQWNVPPPTNCTSAGTSSTLKWINGGAPSLSLNWPSPTYVCIDAGVATSVFQGSGGLADQVGKIYDFPVNDPCNIVGSTPPQGQINKSGSLVKPTTTSPGDACASSPIPPGTPDKYDIVGFAALEIDGVFKGNSTQAGDTVNGCGAVPGYAKDPNAWCLVTSWQGFQFGGGTGSGGGGNFGLVGVNLVGS
jgi:Flp pilus assembly protein TadG